MSDGTDEHDRQEEWGRGGRAALLRAGGLDVEYVKAEGDYVYWEHPQHGTRKAIDLVGGFGATLAGHNHPKLVEVMHDHLRQSKPVLVQGSHRGSAQKVCRKLARMLEDDFQKPFEVMLLNTGTEATEAALKHARLEFGLRQRDFKEKLEADLKRLRREAELGKVILDRRFYRDCEKRLGISPIDSVDALSASLLLANTPTLAHPGYLVAIEGAFHGKTLGSLGLTWNPEARKPFVRGKPNVIFLRPGEASLDIEEEDSRGVLYGLDVDNLTLVEQPFGLFVAIFMEPIRGEGGIVEVEEDVLQVIRDFRERHPQVPVVIDEIQSGLGRTGLVFESLRQKLPIDYMCMGKSLGGGLCKVSALAIERSRYCREFSLLHSSTFSEDELSSEVALRFLDLIEEDDLPGRSDRLGRKIIDRMLDLQKKWPGVIAAIRGQGLMLGVEFVDQSRSRSNAIRALALEERLTVILAGHLLHEHDIRVLPTLGRRSTLRLEPSAYMSEEDLEAVMKGFEACCEILAKANAGRLLHYLVAKGAPPKPEPIEDYSGLPERFDERDEVRSRVAFMGHMILTEHIPLWDPSLSCLDQAETERLSWRVMGAINPHVYTRRIIRSVTGAATELSFLGIFMTSNQIEKDMRLNRSRLIFSQVKKALDLARRLGCSVVGFGGYTSIVTRNLRMLHEDRPALTTGNALTVGIGHEAIKESCADMNFELGKVKAAVCGGTGNIGRVHARLLAGEVGSLLIVGRKGSRDRLLTVVVDIVEELRRSVKEGRSGGQLLARFAESLKRIDGADELDGRALLGILEERGESVVEVSEDLSDLKDVDVIVTASNSAKPIIEPEHLAREKRVLICDIAVPGDVSRRVREECANVSVILGGIVALPKNQDFEVAGIPLPKGQSFACMGETVVLGLSGSGKDFSRGHITTDQIREIVSLAKLHGIQLGAIKTDKSF